MLASIPLLAVIVVVYNFIVFSSPSLLSQSLLTIHLPSGADWFFTLNDLILTLSLFLLYVEIFKSTRTTAASIVDHSLSLLVFIVCLVEFITLRPLANSTFFLIMLMTLIDVIAGFTVTISSARRDIEYQR